MVYGPSSFVRRLSSVSQALAWGAQRVRYVAPRLGAEVLLAHVLGVSRAHLLAHPERLLSEPEWAAYARGVERCAAGEPLFYLIGHREFYGLDFLVDPRVLIPRPETELLVEQALAYISAHCPATIADIGTGSGCIAVTLAVHLFGAPSLRWGERGGNFIPHPTPPSQGGRGVRAIYATDISPAALEVARANAERHGIADKITFLQGDLLMPLPEPVDVIVANLPYVARDEWGQLAAEANVAEFEPIIALDGGPDGLALFRRFFQQAPTALSPGGAILLEIGAGQAEAVMALARAAFPRAHIGVARDYAGLERILSVKTDADSTFGA
jgi:release factor glutamine methyltransferase